MLETYLIAAGVLVLLMTGAKLLGMLLMRGAARHGGRTEKSLRAFVLERFAKDGVPILYVAALYLARLQIVLPPAASTLVAGMLIVAATFFAVRMAVALAAFLLEEVWLKADQNEARRRTVRGMIVLIRVGIWFVAFIFVADNLGLQISALIAGLGIGGIAVALAAQAILGDLFSYFAIFFDRPFEVDDFIIVDEHLGTIEYIGIKTTRIRSLSGEQIVLSNSDLTGSRIRNFKRMERRRIVFRIGVTYETGLQHLREIPRLLAEVVKEQPGVEFDRAHFAAFGDYSLLFEVVYHVLSSDFTVYMDTQQAINLAVFEAFKQRGIDFAYPTQKLFVEPEGPR
jgi:small-conductance mechanosensitive channel